MKIKSNAFSGKFMSQFNGMQVSPILTDKQEPIVGVSGDTQLYGFVEKDALLKTKGLFLHSNQVEG